MNKTTTLLISLFLAQGTAIAAPKNYDNDDIKISTDNVRVNLDWDDREYGWWQNNCLNISSDRVKIDCDKMDSKYRDHYNRSVHSGNNPGKGHDKDDWDNGGSGKYKEKDKGNGKGKNK